MSAAIYILVDHKNARYRVRGDVTMSVGEILALGQRRYRTVMCDVVEEERLDAEAADAAEAAAANDDLLTLPDTGEGLGQKTRSRASGSQGRGVGAARIARRVARFTEE